MLYNEFKMKLIFAQGNPEARYNHTRHNIGFAVIDDFAKAHGAEWTDKPKFHALIAETTIDGEKVLLAKPTTYYNETGLSARSLVDFYKIESHNVLVIHDDLSLPFGTVRVRSKGSDAGNNGIKSLNSHLNEGFRRIRVGIWNEQRTIIDDVDFVLGKLTDSEKDTFPKIATTVEKLLTDFVTDNLADVSMTIPLNETSS
jgi:PTH1 family peptidyl-tRNA hydrolase